MKENSVDRFMRKIQKSAVEKAIEYFDARLLNKYGYPIDKNSVEIALKALRKANKLTPIKYDRHYFKCPCCREYLGIDEDDLYVYNETPPNFCAKCGQALDWIDYTGSEGEE